MKLIAIIVPRLLGQMSKAPGKTFPVKRPCIQVDVVKLRRQNRSYHMLRFIRSVPFRFKTLESLARLWRIIHSNLIPHRFENHFAKLRICLRCFHIRLTMRITDRGSTSQLPEF